MKHKRRVSPQATVGKQQPYDSVLKSLVSGHEQEILAFFLPGAKYIETLDIEALRTPLRLDRVYKVR